MIVFSSSSQPFLLFDVVFPQVDEKIHADCYPQYVSAKNPGAGDGTPELERQPFWNDHFAQKVIFPSQNSPRKDRIHNS
ncbi:unnamed protein product [Caenorhabditis brenneri]